MSKLGRFEVRSMQEIMDEWDAEYEQTHLTEPTRWGSWELDRKYLVLTYTRRGGYQVDLEACTSSAEVLDWIAQVGRKSWCSVEDLGWLTKALCELLDVQGYLCSSGKHKTLAKVDIRSLVKLQERRIITSRRIAKKREIA